MENRSLGLIENFLADAIVTSNPDATIVGAMHRMIAIFVQKLIARW